MMRAEVAETVVQFTTGRSSVPPSHSPTVSHNMKPQADRALPTSPQPIRRLRNRGSRRAQPVLLLVDDLVSSRLLVRMLLEQKGGVRVVEARTSEQALELALRRRFDLVISDIVRPGMNGLEFLQAFRNAHPRTPVMIVSGALNPARRRRAYRLGAFACCMKPTREARLLKAVARALRGPSANG